MSQPAASRPDTPCVAVCSTTFDEVCRGCGRTVVEVAQWVFMSQEEKDRVWERITAQGYPRRQSWLRQLLAAAIFMIERRDICLHGRMGWPLTSIMMQLVKRMQCV